MARSTRSSAGEAQTASRAARPWPRRAATSSAVRPNRKKFSAPTRSRISTLAPSRVPMVRAPFSASFMLPVPEASIPAVEICSERSAAGMISSARLTP